MLITIVLLVQIFLSLKRGTKRERLTPLESGFERLNSRISVRAPFFFLAILFVLFDLELILFFPGVVLFFVRNSSVLLWVIVNFVVVFTLVTEWSLCGLKWQV